jgi:hypothetical protein
MNNSNTEKGLNDCQPPGEGNSVNIDPVPKECGYDGWPSQKQVLRNPAADWKMGGPGKLPPSSQSGRRKLGVGQSGICDPIQAGNIFNDTDNPDRHTVYRYSRSLRGSNEAMWDLFKNIKVADDDGRQHIVPCSWASQEKAVAAILQTNVRKDNSAIVDRIRLPTMAIYASGHAIDLKRFTYQKAQYYLPGVDPLGKYGFTKQEKFPRDTIFGVTRGLPVDINYTLYIWAMFQEDLDQILEQVILKFSPVAYIRVRGVWWEIIVTMDGMTNSTELEPGDDKLRVIKYQVSMTAKTYVPQPVTRYKDDDPRTKFPMTGNEIKNVIETLDKSMNEL